MRIRTRGFLAALASALMSIGAFAGSDERTISFYHIHTQESLTVTYKRDGHFIPEAMKQIDWLMRDWRKNIAIPIDPDTIDIIWEMHRELGSKEPVHVICGHRSEATNEMLRRTNGGQAKHSEHITGKAVDITFPDIPVKQLRYSAMIRERGGVGYYPTSGIPFVHVDTGRVRSWPNMPRDELALLFPSGHSQHRTDDGGYITPSDVKRAREHSPGLAQQVAAFFEARDRQQAILLADVASARAVAIVGGTGHEFVAGQRHHVVARGADGADLRQRRLDACRGGLHRAVAELVVARHGEFGRRGIHAGEREDREDQQHDERDHERRAGLRPAGSWMRVPRAVHQSVLEFRSRIVRDNSSRRYLRSSPAGVYSTSA